MPTRALLSEGQRARFSALPDMDRRDLVRHHTLSEADLASVGARRGAANRLGFAVQLCLLRYPGRPLTGEDTVCTVPVRCLYPQYLFFKRREAVRHLSVSTDPAPEPLEECERHRPREGARKGRVPSGRPPPSREGAQGRLATSASKAASLRASRSSSPSSDPLADEIQLRGRMPSTRTSA